MLLQRRWSFKGSTGISQMRNTWHEGGRESDHPTLFRTVASEILHSLQPHTVGNTVTDDLELGRILASEVFLLVDPAVSSDLYDHVCGQRVNYRSTYSVESAGYLVSSAAELTAGVQLCVDDLNSRDSHLRMDVYRHSTSVVLDGDRVVFFDSYLYMFTKSCQRFIDRVVHDLVYEMMESRRACTSDVHTRSQTYRFKTLKYLYLTCAVLLLLSHYVLPFFVCHRGRSF